MDIKTVDSLPLSLHSVTSIVPKTSCPQAIDKHTQISPLPSSQQKRLFFCEIHRRTHSICHFFGIRIILMGLVLMLTACKIDLYNKLSEEEANQMLALLILRHIDAEKQAGKSGDITLKVEKDQFVNAVEILRQYGYPKRKTDTIADLFPSGQLVTSPAQEHAKMTYLKEQQLEKMLNSMDGVIQAQVSIAEGMASDNAASEVPAPSAAVFIKYSPEANLTNREAEIKSLIHDGIPNLHPENISIVLQAADYRYLPKKMTLTSSEPVSATPPWQYWLTSKKWGILAIIGAVTLLILIGLFIIVGKRSRSVTKP